VTEAIFLDRDNTLIANDGDLGDASEVSLLDGVGEGLRELREAGYRLVVVTNQGGVARGAFTEEDVDAVHQRIAELVDHSAGMPNVIDRFYYCPYHPDAEIEEYRRDHPWRKPNPGMMLQAARDLKLDLTRSWLIGDQGRDVEAGRAAGCRTVLVSRDANGAEESEGGYRARDFSEAVRTILREAGHDLPETGVSHSDGERQPDANRSGHSVSARQHAFQPSSAVDLKRAIDNLTEELRTERQSRAEFTGFRLAAGLCQLLVLLLALLGLLQLGTTELFLKWMVGAVLVQLLTIALLMLDARS
jgi:D,D-heptose 1,7-bisphosphate phosphatase